LPPHCKSFDHICALEAQRRYSEAFERYEERYEACGDWGWTLDGNNRGYDAAVAFKTTPCGTRVVIKGSRHSNTLQRIEKECRRLQFLSSPPVSVECPRCFPVYYYFSNRTRACYSELVAHPPDINGRAVFGKGVGKLWGARFRQVRHLIAQGLHSLEVLWRHGIEHRDVTFRNVLFRYDPAYPENTPTVDGRPRLQLVIFDFGASRLLHENVTLWKRAGNRGLPDVYAYTCSWLHHIDLTHRGCHYVVPAPPDHQRPESLEWALLQIVATSSTASTAETFRTAIALVRNTTQWNAVAERERRWSSGR
jgi:serine/threonine protein kinase